MTKVYIKYKELRQRKFRYASCVVDDLFTTSKEAEKHFEFGNKYNNFIEELVLYSKHGALSNWEIFLVEPTDETPSNYINLNDKPKFIKESEKILKELKSKLKNLEKEYYEITTKKETIRTQLLTTKEKLEQLKAENIKLIEEEYNVPHHVAKWVQENWKLFLETQQYFPHTTQSILNLYAKHNNTKPIKYKGSFPDKKSKSKGEYIEVLGYKVNAQLFRNYVYHIKRKNIKKWQLAEYEEKRVQLHQQLFNAIGGDRLDRNSEEGKKRDNAINDVLNAILRCSCGGTVNHYDRCIKCHKTVTISDYFFNIKQLIIK